MAEISTTLTPPSATMKTELWYKASTGTLTQVFGVQSIPPVKTAAEDITYGSLESSSEFAVKGTRKFESIEVETILYKEQFKALTLLDEAEETLEWFVKTPANIGIILSWKGGIDVSMAEIAMDDMYKSTLKIGKVTVPVMLDEMPSTFGGK